MSDGKMPGGGGDRDESLGCFLAEAGLSHHLASIRDVLHVFNVSQLKYVEADDLYRLGMSKPEVRRLKNAYHKHRDKAKHSKYTAKIRNFLQVLKKVNEIVSLKILNTEGFQSHNVGFTAQKD